MTGVALAAASAPFWLEMSMLTECKRWTAAGLNKLDEAGARSTRHEMVLQNALCTSDILTRGFSDTVRAALTRAGELAEMFHDIDHQMLALVGLATACHRLEQFHEALSLSRRAEAIAKEIADPPAIWTAHRLLSTSYFFLGEYADAMSNAQKVHRVTTPEVRRARIVRSGLDYAALAGYLLRLAGNPELRKQLGRQGRRRAEAMFSESSSETTPCLNSSCHLVFVLLACSKFFCASAA